MNMQEAISSVLSKYANFSGRARRSEYWYWTLATVIAATIAGLLDAIVGGQIIGYIVLLATFIPTIAVGARRLHDTGRSGWLQLIGLIPFVGWIFVVVWWASDSHPDNKYGPSPKGGGPGAFGQASPTTA